ncbi:hypothetical protein [Nostoc sp. WHI]|uniref:hypothetical protein n=1 Tax=Nostoc sp. WHI TaxID=2650611 RepID=UPI0018C7E4B4|nr:hypothetical protein [Nostoc sp. WHI]MBG1268252.1 hypothetical protein [Nostoc sp. WHI]
MPLGIGLDIVQDECNFGVQFSGTFLFFKIPPVQIVYRNPDCFPQPEEPQENNDYEEDLEIPDGLNIYFLYQSYAYTSETLYLGNNRVGRYESKTTQNIANVEFPYQGDVTIPAPWNPNIQIKPLWKLDLIASASAQYNGVWRSTRLGNRMADSEVFTYSHNETFTFYGDNSKTLYTAYYNRSGGFAYEHNFYYFQTRDMLQRYVAQEKMRGRPVSAYRITSTNEISGSTRTDESIYAIYGAPAPPPKIEPPPPPKKECCKMGCCPDNSNLERLLRLLIKRVGEPKQVTIFDEDLTRQGAQKTTKTPQSLNDYFKLTVDRIEIANRIIGIDTFPVTVPDTMIEPFKEGVFAKVFGFIDGKKKRKINNITEFIAWMSEQDSAVLGEFHQVIEYQTQDKKTATIVLPNVAESLKEIVLLTSQMAKQNNIQTELIFKMATEIVATRAVATKGTTVIQDIQDYLDYPTNTKKAKINTAISLPKFNTNKEGIPIATQNSENPKNFLKVGEVEYTYDDWTGSNSLHDQLLDLLQLAAMLRAIYFQRTDQE